MQQRGLQIESTFGSLLLMAEKLGLVQVELTFGFGSWNVTSPLADALAKSSTYLLVAFLAISYWFIYRQMKPGENQFTRLGAYSILVIAVTIVTSKVLSPQYLIWLIPLIPLFFNRWQYLLLAIFAGIGILTYYIFPHNYIALLDLQTAPIAVLLMRNTLLVLLAVAVVVLLRRMKTSD